MLPYPKNIAPQGHLNVNTDFQSFKLISDEFGAKAAGLFLLPTAWVPIFAAVSTNFYAKWKKEALLEQGILEEMYSWIASANLSDIIIRSSSKNERISDRGKYKSVSVRDADQQKLSAAVLDIFSSASVIDPDDEMGLVIQELKNPMMIGHLSNELRVSPTRNQWAYEIEDPWSGPKGLNSKYAPAPDPTISLPLNRNPHQSLRSVGRWCCDNFAPRCHLEWLGDNNDLQIVQLDFEWRELDTGSDPTQELTSSRSTLPEPSAQENLKQYQIGTETRWKKLRNLSEFGFDSTGTAPIIFELPSASITRASHEPAYRDSLVGEIESITGNRAVVRTDVDQDGFPRFNLPRTDTVCAEEAVSWCQIQLQQLAEKGASQEGVMFLLHAFLPALASAWAYADPGENEVKIDALWGLPDGLQVLPVDSYEAIPSRNKIIKTRSTFKPMYLRECEDGEWMYVNILRSKGRSKVLSNNDILEIAKRTKEIADRIEDTAQIMWFCGIPLEYGVGRNLPWFRARETFDPAPRTEDKYKSFRVRNLDDLKNVPSTHVAIEFAPSPELIRDDEFLSAVIERAKELKIPVKLNGSVLGHVYYRLCEEQVGIILPNAAKYRRIRDKRVFGKIVRDKIANNITEGGEDAVEAILREPDAVHGLAAKMAEELEELIKAGSDAEKSAELADVLEVVRGLAYHLKIDWTDLVSKADAKVTRVGGFQQRKVLVETSLPRARSGSGQVGEVSLSDIGSGTVAGSKAEIPLSGIFNTIDRRPVSVNLPEAGVSIQLSVKAGKLQLSVQPDSGDVDDDRQGSLF